MKKEYGNGYWNMVSCGNLDRVPRLQMRRGRRKRGVAGLKPRPVRRRCGPRSKFTSVRHPAICGPAVWQYGSSASPSDEAAKKIWSCWFKTTSSHSPRMPNLPPPPFIKFCMKLRKLQDAYPVAIRHNRAPHGGSPWVARSLHRFKPEPRLRLTLGRRC